MKIALVGNQNSGKSTLFNTLTGSNQKIGNWPGVTVEKKSGIIKGTNYELIDLPGTYSLNPFTSEEAITTEFILNNKADVIINAIDCNSIARGLYLTMQLLELNKNVIVVLNMYELAEKKGIKVNSNKLSEKLGNIPIVKISALKGEGIEDIIAELNKFKHPKIINIPKVLSKVINEEEIITRYKTIDRILYEVQKDGEIEEKQGIKIKKISVTDKVDKIFLNKFLAIPIFMSIMFFIYYFSIDVIGNNTTSYINSIFKQFTIFLKEALIKYNTTPELISLLTDGIISGISTVMSFLPQLIFLFMAISYLEKLGYMSRISLIFDRLFKKLGLSGNSIISFIIGTGCSVPRYNGNKNHKK